MPEKLLFKVEKVCVPDYGYTEDLFTKYIYGNSLEEVKQYVYKTYGKAKYYSMDRCEDKYYFHQIKMEEAKIDLAEDY